MPRTAGVWPRKKATFWQRAPFFRVLLPLVAGIFVYDRWGAKHLNGSLMAGLLLLLFSFVLWVLLRRKSAQTLWLTWLRFIFLNLFFLLAGWLSCYLSDIRNDALWYGQQRSDSSIVMARIVEAPKELPKTQKLEVQLLAKLDKEKKLQAIQGKAFLLIFKSKDAPVYQRGDTVLFPARWQAISNSSNPFSFDYAGFCARKGIYDQTFAGAQEVALYGRAQTQQFSWLWRVNMFCTQQLQQYLPQREAFGLLQAMLLGNEQDFDPELRQAYADTGVVHIVSISGSHTAMLFLVVTWLFFWLRAPRWQWLKYAAGVALVWTYVLVAGAPPSALRSAVMFTVFAFSFMTGREQQPLNTLLMAAFVLLLANPMFLFAIGFQLSFVAVLSLILFYQPIYGLWPQRTLLGRRLWQLTAGSLAVEILIAPLVAFYFHNFPVLVLVANIAAMLLLGIIALVGGLAILAFSWWPFVANLLGVVVSFFVTLFNRMIVQMQGWSPAAMKHLVLSLPEMILLYGVILFISVFLFKKKKPALFAGLSLFGFLLVLLLQDQYQALRQQKLIVYQVSNRSLIDVVRAKRFFSLGRDTAGSGHRVTVTARTGFSAWKPAIESLPPAFVLSGKKVLLWEEKFLPEKLGTVDVLIVSDSLKHFTLHGLQQAFEPREIVVTGPQSRWLLRQWADSARLQGVAFHSVLLDGAFVME